MHTQCKMMLICLTYPACLRNNLIVIIVASYAKFFDVPLVN